MKREGIDLIELLVLWHKRKSLWMPVEGYPRECPSTAGFKGSRQFDDVNGQQEADAESQLCQHIENVINGDSRYYPGIAEPYRTALHMVARNRASGVSVWTSARLPADADKRAEVVAEAMERFAEAL